MNETSSVYSPAGSQVRSGGRDAVRAGLLAERARTLVWADAYARALGPQMPVPQSVGLNPPLWELGHIGWFQQWWIARNTQRAQGPRCDPGHLRLNSELAQADAWYDSSAVAHASRWALPLPRLAATREWLASTLAQTLALLDALPPDAGDDALYFYRLICLHEAMHAEAASYMARELGFEVPLPEVAQSSRLNADAGAAVRVQSAQSAAGGHPPDVPSRLHIPRQLLRLGHEGPGFAFDNELSAHTVRIGAFEIDAQPLSWSRFQGFVQAGGYDRSQWWTSEGWAWRKHARAARPTFPHSETPAVHLSAHEAEAWCCWAGRRLPTEAEWECAARTQPDFAWGRVWEWTASTFAPYPGFKPHPYRDYSAPWFGARRVLRGACDATSACMRSLRYRNFFELERTDVYAGFRPCA